MSLWLSYPLWIQLSVAAVFGLMVGSFLNVCICRIPKGKSIVWPRSFCPDCRRPITCFDNIPILSYILLRGHCRYCHSPIAKRYPIVEGVTAILSLLLYWHFQEPLRTILYFLFLVSPLIVITFIDLELKIIPDCISLPGIAAGFLIRQLFTHHSHLDVALDSALGVLVGGGFLFLVAFLYEKIKKREGLGGGDVKLMAMLGAFFGWQEIIFILLLSSLLGSLLGGAMIILFRKGLHFEIPFGPFIAAAALINLLVGDAILQRYISLF